MTHEKSKQFPTADVLSTLFNRDLSFTAGGKLRDGVRYKVGNFMVGEDSQETIDVKDPKQFHQILRDELIRQHPVLASIRIEELNEIQSKIPWVRLFDDPELHEASKKEHLAAIKEWVDKQVAKVGSKLNIKELSRNIYPRIKVPSPEVQLFMLECLAGQSAIDLSEPGAQDRFLQTITNLGGSPAK